MVLSMTKILRAIVIDGAIRAVRTRRSHGLAITNAIRGGVLSLCVASCAPSAIPSAPPTLSAPSPVLPPTANPLAVFTDPLTGLSTSDVRDARDHVVQFTTASELIWTDGTRLPGHEADGPGHRLIGNAAPEASCQCWLVVRFGASAGERRAYLTADVGHSNPGTLVELEINGSALVVSWSDLFPPGTYTLSGVVTGATAGTGPAPIENAEVWRVNEEEGGWDHTTTDKSGFYELHGLSDGSRQAAFIRDGYQTIELRDVPVHGDTRFDVQLLRR